MERDIGINKLKTVILDMDKAAQKAGIKNLRVILCGGLAAIAYGIKERITLDIDAEIDTDFKTIFKTIERLKKNIKFPAEISSNTS